MDLNADGVIDYQEFLTWTFATPGVRTKDLEAFRSAAVRLSTDGTRRASCSAHDSLVDATLGEPHPSANSAAADCMPNIPTVAADVREPDDGTGISAMKDVTSTSAEAPVDQRPAADQPQPVDQPPRPEDLVNVRLVNLGGNEIGNIDDIDIARTAGLELKHTIADTFGFPARNMKLVLTSGDTIDNTVLNSQPHFCRAHEGCSDGYLLVCCLPSAAKPIGRKRPQNGGSWHGHKAGMLLCNRIERAARQGELGSIVSTLRTPVLELRKESQQLIQESFADHLGPLINLAVDASYHADVEASTLSDYTYVDDKTGASADLGSCRLWTRVFNDPTPYAVDSSLACAILWRLLCHWEGSSPEAAEGHGQGGPVLEVLFLATSPDLRESGEAGRLVKELEEAATVMGCSAIAVAAVPQQGISFWTRAGYEIAVPLSKDTSTNPGGPGPGEPTSALGNFLFENMVIFTDTPLVAKVLS
jgi:hypothetical protein